MDSPPQALLATNGRGISQFGLGLATLMREPSKRRRLAVLERAYALGVRHFDVAPLYGLGRAEPELGEFLATHGIKDATVATKFGLTPSLKARMVSPVQGPLRAAMRRSETLRRFGKSAERSAGAVASLPPSLLKSSVEQSLERLRLDRIDVLILHEVLWSPDWAAVWDEIASAPGYAGIGASGTAEVFATYPDAALRTIPFTQGPASTLLKLPPGPQRSFHSVINLHAPAVTAAVVGMAGEERRALRELVGGDLDSQAMRSLAIASLMVADSSCLVLAGTTNADHLEQLLRSVGSLVDQPAGSGGEAILRGLVAGTEND